MRFTMAAPTKREREHAMSRSLTLHNIDDELYAAVRDYAARSKISLSAAFKQLARRALGLPTEEEQGQIARFRSTTSGSRPRR